MVSRQTITCALAAPQVSVKQFFPAVGWPLAVSGLFLLVFALVALSSPGRIDIVDGQTRYEVARSLVDHGDSIIRDPAAWFAVYEGRDGQKYSDYRIPQSALGVVAIHLADATGPISETRRQFFFSLISPCMAGLLAVVYALWFRGLGHSARVSLAWAAAGIFCTPTWFYATSTFDDILGTLGIVLAVALAWLSRDRRPLLGALLAGLAMAWAVNCKPPLVVFTLVVLAAGYRSRVALRRQLLPASLVGLGIGAGVVFLRAYHAYKFPPGTTDVFAEYTRLYGPWTTLNPLPGLVSLALSPSCGVLWYCPTMILGFCGWYAWRGRWRWFCLATLASSLLFVLSICFLPFFKGDPCWGPRYLTPVFALWWVFVPAALEQLSLRKAKMILRLGLVVQLLAVSVDPLRLFIQLPLNWSYYNEFPWLGFSAQVSHLLQRPRELVEVLTPQDTRAVSFSPAVLPTHAGCFATGAPAVASLAGLMAGPGSLGALNVTVSYGPTFLVQRPVITQQGLQRYHIYSAPRPWVFSQWYLAEDARPVDLARTAGLLAGLGCVGLVLVLGGCRTRPLALRVARPSSSRFDPELLPVRKS
jgi:hypothetical protein